jgi:hypothetical protein
MNINELTLEEDLFDFDKVCDSTSALEFYVGVREQLMAAEKSMAPELTFDEEGNPMRRESTRVIVNGEECNPMGKLLRDTINYDSGFVKGVLPAGIKDVLFNTEGYSPSCEYEISFAEKIDQGTYKAEWEELGFATEMRKQTLVVVDPADGKDLVKYAIKRVKIPEAKIERYLTLVKEVNEI